MLGYGKKKHTFGHNGKRLFEQKPKASEPDSVGRKTRPAAHGAQQAKIAKRAKNRVKRLSGQSI